MTPEEFIYKKQLISPHSFIFSSYGDKDYTLVELLTEYAKHIEQNSHKHGVMQGLPDSEIYKWLKSKKYQSEYEETGEYRMLYEIDFPKIIRDFAEHLGSPSVASEGQGEANMCAGFWCIDKSEPKCEKQCGYCKDNEPRV